ncbi:MAG: methyltransferase domain-containing protein [SAR202 cluster bacterium]|nr:methyltransferase domain-containing protein [SAR202 cluster bacterium]
MHSCTLEILVCPECRAALALQGAQWHADQVVSGSLLCSRCGQRYLIDKGIPRFVDAKETYCDNFGWQWDRFRRTQLDHLNGTQESRKRFLAETQWRLEELRGQLVLDAGCGAGRFTAIACQAGARVVAVDLTAGAAEACARTVAEVGGQADVIQASLYKLPFRTGAFDCIFSLGVLQHTPDPKKAMRALPPLLKPGGRLAYWVYEKRWYRFLILRNHLRGVTRRLPVKANWMLSGFLVALFFPFTTVISLVPGVKKALPLVPISSRHYWGILSLRQQWEWTLLDTFDSYSAAYEFPQRQEDVITALTEAGMAQVYRTSARGMAIVAKNPEAIGQPT